MKLAFIMDPLAEVKAHKDTTYFIMLAAHERGHEVFYLDQRDLLVIDAALYGNVSPVAVHADIDSPFSVDAPALRPMADMDVVFVRTDPPVDRRYFYTTLLLDLLPASTRVVNPPAALRNWNEKLAALFYPDISPTTRILRTREDILAFAEGEDRVTLKPIDGHGGAGIEFLRHSDADAAQKIERVTHGGTHWVIAQRYLPEAADGDRRILILDGQPLGTVLRMHQEGVELNNLDAGGSALPAELDDRDRELCRRIAPGLAEQGIVFCGIDVIGGLLIEINITSPTLLQELCRYSGQDFHHQIVARFEP